MGMECNGNAVGKRKDQGGKGGWRLSLLSEFGGKVIVLVVFVDCGMMIISLVV